MSRIEKLKEHMEKLSTLKANILQKQQEYRKADEEFQAHAMAFNGWLHTELGFPKEKTADILMPEILLKWDETNDNTTESNH